MPTAEGIRVHAAFHSLPSAETSCQLQVHACQLQVHMHLASPNMLRLTKRAAQELWRNSILNQNAHHLTHSTRDLSSNSSSQDSVGAERQAVGVGRQWAAPARKYVPLQSQRQICNPGRGKSNGKVGSAMRRAWPGAAAWSGRSASR